MRRIIGPGDWISRSHGDLLTRLSSNITIRDTLTNQMISTFLDGGTVLVYLLVLLSQSWLFALSTCLIGLLQASCLLASTRLIHELTVQDLMAQSKAQGYMAEALAGIATLKSSGPSSTRCSAGLTSSSST